jgi:hypothetical protein
VAVTVKGLRRGLDVVGAGGTDRTLCLVVAHKLLTAQGLAHTEAFAVTSSVVRQAVSRQPCVHRTHVQFGKGLENGRLPGVPRHRDALSCWAHYHSCQNK